MKDKKIAEKNIQFSGKSGVLVLVAVLAFVGFRFATLGENKDPDLRKAIMLELTNQMGGEAQTEMNRLKASGSKDYSRTTKLLNPENIKIHSIYTSRPILSYSSDQDVVVKLESSMPGVKRNTRYYLYEHGLISGWRYKYTASAYRYYSNFF